MVVCNQTSLRFNLFTSISIFSNLKPSFQKMRFLRVGGRTALHTALLRPGYESGRIAVLNEILSDDRCGPAGVLVNVQDDIGRSPLWYAARECFVGCARCLIRAGALVSLDSMSSLRLGNYGKFFCFLECHQNELSNCCERPIFLDINTHFFQGSYC